MRINKFKKLSFVLLVLTIFTTFISPPISANNIPTLRVAFYPMNGFHYYNENQEPDGYDVQYLNQLSSSSGWEYQYIPADSFSHALELLEQNKVDLVGGVRDTPEISERFSISSYTAGYTCLSLLALADNDALLYEDHSKISSLRIGYMGSNSAGKADYENYAYELGFIPRLTSFPDMTTLKDALKYKRIDAMLCELSEKTEAEKTILKMEHFDYHYITQKDQTDLMTQLNRAMLNLKVNQPDFENALFQQYYAFQNDVPLTKEELDFRKNITTLRVGCIGDRAPISYFDAQINEVAGITREILDMVADGAGIKFEYVALPSSDVTFDVIESLNIDLISGVEKNNINENLTQLQLSAPYLNGEKVIVCRKGEIFSAKYPLKMAIASSSQTINSNILQHFPNFEIINYETTEQCFEAVRKMEVDVLLQAQFAVNDFLEMPRYSHLAIVPNVSMDDTHCLSSIKIKSADNNPDPILSDPLLLSILNKSIANLNETTIRQIIIKHTTARPRTISFRDFLDQYHKPILIIFALFTFGIIIAAYAMRIKQKHMQMIQQNEKTLSYITNNINGGVILLSPDKGFPILYANNGFLNLLGCSHEEYKNRNVNEYVAYVHKSDIGKLNTALEQRHHASANIETELRIRKNDGTYVPTLFRASCGKTEAGELVLYCVVVDYTNERKMMSELILEQERYQIVLENSNDILFDADFEKEKLMLSKQYQQTFGHTTLLSGTFHKHLFDSVLHPEDVERWLHSLSVLCPDAPFCSTQLRMCRYDHTYLWCDIQVNALYDESLLVRYVGRIVDINDDVKERERLEKMSRIDALTGLLNKSTFIQDSQNYLEGNGKGRQCILIFIDLDHFKEINDSLGHLYGDLVLQETAKKLMYIFPNDAFCARFGGDEFCILVKNLSLNSAKKKCAQICESVENSYPQDNGDPLFVSASVGVAIYPAHCTNLEALLNSADKALYQAKEKGRNRYEFYYESAEYIRHSLPDSQTDTI